MQRVCLDGCSSAWVYVLSGVPQGSVLGPLLFLIFVNDLEYDILSLILKFADDTKVFGRVSNSAQRQLLQDDLDKLCAWAVGRWSLMLTSARLCTSEAGISSSAI